MSYSQDLAQIINPTLEDFLRIASKNLPESKRTFPWRGLSHGLKLLENDDEMAQYLCAYGKMHKEKIVYALGAIKAPRDYFTKKISIIDWGCGQGLATICFFDYLRNLGITPNIQSVVLIEPSTSAIDRAKEHLCKYVDSNKVVLVNKYINDVVQEDISSNADLVIHFFSNILDIISVDIEHLARIIKSGVQTEQLFFCVGPLNRGASRISEFANLFNISNNCLIEKYSNNLTERGTISLLVFKIEAEQTDIIKVEYLHKRNLRIENYTSLQRVLAETVECKDLYESAFQFYKSIIELESIKSVSSGDVYPYVIKDVESTRLNIDIQENKSFEDLFNQNFDNRSVNVPKNLNIGIGIIIENRLYQLFQYLYPQEDLRNIDIKTQYISIELSSFNVNADIATDLQIGDELVNTIESVISDPTTTLKDLEELIQNSVGDDVIIDKNLYLSLTAKNPALGQIRTELKHLQLKKDGELLRQFLTANIISDSHGACDEDELLQIVPADKSQLKAIASALDSKVSVITGPPGTGKTQMILNLIANAYMRGKTVLVASKNNEAVNNIKERYDNVDNSRYLLRFGSRNAVTEMLLPYLELIQRKVSELEFNKQYYVDLKSQYDSHCQTIHEGKAKLTRLASLLDEKRSINNKIRENDDELKTLQLNYEKAHNALTIKYQDILDLSRCEYDWEKEYTNIRIQKNTLQSKYSGIWKLFFNWFSKKKYALICLNKLLQMPSAFTSFIESKSQVSCLNDVKNGQTLISFYEFQEKVVGSIIKCISEFQNLEHQYKTNVETNKLDTKTLQLRQSKLKKEICKLVSEQDVILESIREKQQAIKDISVELFNLSVLDKLSTSNPNIIAQYKNYLPEGTPRAISDVPLYVENARSFLNIFRLNAVTNLSIKNCYPLSESFFDMVIIDEASQCDIASELPLIYRAKQLVVIGDPLQLKHISAVNADEEMAIKNHLKVEENSYIRYADYSLWDYCRDLITASKDNNIPIVLDCHYRCHPQIIGYSNQMFYQKKLGVTLDIRSSERNPLLKEKGIIWKDVKGKQKSNTLNVNEEEITECLSIVKSLTEEYPDISIGIISPFRHQAEKIKASIPEKLSDCINVGTVHAFQGNERDVVIYSLVVTNNSPASKIKWIDCSVPNLVNVAVTRARTSLYVVGNKDYIRAHSNVDLPLGNLLAYAETHGHAPYIKHENTYIIDTNIFVQSPDIIDRINAHDYIVLSAKVIDELDKLKVCLENDSLHNVELALRNINRKFNERNIRMECADLALLPRDLNRKNPDNLILSIALKYRNHNPILLTNDNCLQIKAKGLQIATMTLREFVG
jgi:hypothetical protein